MYDLAIVGAGPAGTSAAIFTSKAGKKTLLLDSADGMTQYAWVRNHYGVKDIDGPDLTDVGVQQAKDFGTEVVKALVTGVHKENDGFKLATDTGEFVAKHVLIATGEHLTLAKSIGLKIVDGLESDIPEMIDVDFAGHTSIDGIWAAGAIAGASVHTIVTAGDGARVAINLLSELQGERYVDHDAFTD